MRTIGDQRKKRGGSGFLRCLLAVLMLFLALILLLRGRGAPVADPAGPASSPEALVLADDPAEEQVPDTKDPADEQGTSAQNTPEPPEKAASAPASLPQPIVYDERSYQLVTDMVYAYRKQLPDRAQIISADIAALKAHDPRLGEAWGGIMDYWNYANEEMVLHFDALPEDLPQDDSLCLVVLGFQLAPDGSMSPELLGRCTLALKAAQQYPNAFLAVTGGGTAYLHPEVTEAGMMSAWLQDQGIPAERLILEDRSSTTEENARNTLGILVKQYPQVKSLAIISSDYHLPLGCLLFTEAALLYCCEHGEVPFTVVSNLALSGYGLNEYKNPAEQSLYVWALADPQPYKD